VNWWVAAIGGFGGQANSQHSIERQGVIKQKKKLNEFQSGALFVRGQRFAAFRSDCRFDFDKGFNVPGRYTLVQITGIVSTFSCSFPQKHNVHIWQGWLQCGSRKLPLKVILETSRKEQFKRPLAHLVESPKKQYFLVSPTESAGCVFSESEQCCYRTFDLINKDMAFGLNCLLKCGSRSCIIGHPWYDTKTVFYWQ
jgi:hypothetical protein